MKDLVEKETKTQEEDTREKGPTRKERRELVSDSVEKQERTLFIGNLSVACATDKNLIKELKARFSIYGTVESIRFRSIPFAEPQARRVAFIKKNFRKDGTGGTCNGYVVMKTRESALLALKENATIFSERHLRVDLAAEGEGSTKTNTKKSIFIGNLPMDLEEEPVWVLFGKCGAVTNVRLVRDRVTNMGKGIGYVTFASKDSVDLALKLTGTMLGNRPVRVSPCAKIGMVEKKKVRANNLAEKRQKQAAALVKMNPTSTAAAAKLGAIKGTSGLSHPKEISEEAEIKKVSKKEAKLQAELQTKFGQLFHKKFPFAQAISDVKGPSCVDSNQFKSDKSKKFKSLNEKISNSSPAVSAKVVKSKVISKMSDKAVGKVADKSSKFAESKSMKSSSSSSFKNNISRSKLNSSKTLNSSVENSFKPTKIRIPTSKPTSSSNETKKIFIPATKIESSKVIEKRKSESDKSSISKKKK